MGAVLGRAGEEGEVSLGEGEESVGGYRGETEWEAGQGNSSRLDTPSHFTRPCTYVQCSVYKITNIRVALYCIKYREAKEGEKISCFCKIFK